VSDRRSGHRIDLRSSPDDPTLLSPVLDHLRGGGLIAYPTETVYGLGCLIRPEPVRRLLELKDRGPDRPLLLLVHDVETVDELRWTREARELADVFWPGAVTLVLDDPYGHFPPGIRSPAGGVAVRRTPDPVARALLRLLDEPLTSTSANVPGGEPARSADGAGQVLEALDCRQEAWLLDGGARPPSEPSTIIDCTVSPVRVLREGAVPTSRVRCVRPEAT